MKMLLSLQPFILQAQEEAQFILEDRVEQLNLLSDLIHEQLRIKGSAELVFICTHNSRRSHFAQVWAQIFALAQGFDQISCFSGGTEATEVYHNTLAALERAGLELDLIETDTDTVPEIRFAENLPELRLLSKRYDDPINPQRGFTAIMTCDDADANCPVIPDALVRFALPYEDPKSKDGQAYEDEAYDETCLQIASEMYYLMSRL